MTVDRCIICAITLQKQADDRGQRIIEKTIRDTTGLLKAPEMGNGKRKEVKEKERKIIFSTFLSLEVFAIMFALHKVI